LFGLYSIAREGWCSDVVNRIHKRLIDLNAPTEVVKQIIINIEAGVEVEVTIAA